MSKMSEMEATIRELRDIASSINDIANWLTDAFGNTDSAEAAPTPEKTYSLEEVRAILAEKSRDGFTAQIRDLLQKYGAIKLSEVDPTRYGGLVADAEVLGNGESCSALRILLPQVAQLPAFSKAVRKLR